MNRTTLAIIGIAVAVVGVIVFSSLFTVYQTQQALILQFGNPVRVDTEPGLKFKVPFIQNVEFFDKRILHRVRAEPGLGSPVRWRHGSHVPVRCGWR